MKKSIKIIFLSSIIIGCSIFIGTKVLGKNYKEEIEIAESEREKALKTISTMIKAYKKRKWKKFKSCWFSKKNKEIKEQLYNFEEEFPEEFELREGVCTKDPKIILIRGYTDCSSETFEFRMQKVKGKYKIKSIFKDYM